MARAAKARRPAARKPGNKAVAKRKTTAVAEPVDYGNYGGAGFEETDSSHFSVPFLALLQGKLYWKELNTINLKSGTDFTLLLT